MHVRENASIESVLPVTCKSNQKSILVAFVIKMIFAAEKLAAYVEKVASYVQED